MKTVLVTTFMALGTWTLQSAPPAEVPATPAAVDEAAGWTPDGEILLRSRALDFAGALANDSFEARDGFWFVRASAPGPRRLAVNLFAGNQYWFCASSAPESPAPKLSVYDPEGKAVEIMTHSGPGLAAAGMTASATGRYVVEVGAAEGGSTPEFCLLYLFR